MDLHRIVVFSHVAGVIGLFAALAIEWVSLRSLRSATSYERAREWTGLWTLLVPLGAPSAVVVLASGIYLATTLGAWKVAWVEVAVPTFVIVALAGGIIGPRRSRLRAAIATGGGPLPIDLQTQLRQPLFRASWRFRVALLAGLLFEMTVRPDYSGLLVMTGAGLVGIGWSLLPW